MSPLKIRQLCFNCFSSALAPTVYCFAPFNSSAPPLLIQRKNRSRKIKVVSFDPLSSVLSTLQLMQFNRFDSPCHYSLSLRVHEFMGMLQLVQLWVSVSWVSVGSSILNFTSRWSLGIVQWIWLSCSLWKINTCPEKSCKENAPVLD